MVSRAQRAQLVVFFPERGEGHTPRVTGNLMCTNYRLCFLPEPESALKVCCVGGEGVLCVRCEGVLCVRSEGVLCGG